MTRLCLLRHGQTSFNLQGRWQGHSDIPLNETGLEQARRAADELSGEHFTAIYSSDLQRARVTAEIIAGKQALSVKTDPRLRELNMGLWEGQLLVDVPEKYPEAWAERLNNPVDARAPGGETLRELADRMFLAISDICAEYQPDDRLLIVAHGLSLASFLCQARSLPLVEAFERIPKNATPISLDWPSILQTG